MSTFGTSGGEIPRSWRPAGPGRQDGLPELCVAGAGVIQAQTTAQLQALRTQNGAAIAPASQALSDSILRPAAEMLTGERVLVVSDGALQRVPFSMLLVGAKGEPLVVTHETVSLPSASTIAMLRAESQTRRAPTRSIAIFADPLFTGAAVSMRMLEHFHAGNVPQLPYTRREAERIVKLTPKPRNLLALGARANRTAAMDPSALLLSFENEKHEPEDGFLRVYDIYDLRFNADLVVLSACQAGLGKDQATADLMTTMYRRMLKDHQRPAAALRQARLALRKQARWASPYHWAAFVQQGEWK